MSARTGLLVATLLLVSCSVAPRNEAPDFEIDSRQSGFTQVHMLARESARGPSTSLVEFEDLDPDRGAALTKSIFRLRSAAGLAQHRGYRYFVILRKDPAERQYLVGLLHEPATSFAERFGEPYAGISSEGVLDTRRIKPLP